MQVFGHSLGVLKQLQPPLSSQLSGKVSNYINEVKIQDPRSIQCVKIQEAFNVFSSIWSSVKGKALSLEHLTLNMRAVS